MLLWRYDRHIALFNIFVLIDVHWTIAVLARLEAQGRSEVFVDEGSCHSWCMIFVTVHSSSVHHSSFVTKLLASQYLQ